MSRFLDEEYDFGGRLREKQEEQHWDGLVRLPLESIALVYQRLSSHEQVKRSVYSIAMQDALVDLARDDGYDVPLTDEQIEAIKSDEQYPGWFVNGQVLVEQRDLGISGTLGQEKREGLANVISLIENDKIESIYVVHISRLFRDQTLIDGFAFGELCKEHNVIIVMPNMRLNLRDKMHMRIYRIEVERAAEELEIMKARLGGARELKARQGYYTGGSIPVGFVLNTEKAIEVEGRQIDNPGYQKYTPYEAHSSVVRTIFRLMRMPNMDPPKAARHCKRNSIVFPPLPEELWKVKANRMVWKHSKRNPDGSWPVTVRHVRSIATNPVYIGWWVWDGEIISTDNHPAIVDDATFWAVQERFRERSLGPVPKKDHPPLPLGGLLYCGLHDVPHRMVYSNNSNHKGGSYMDTDLESGIDCCYIAARFVDNPVGEAVVSQCSYPELVDKVIDQLIEEYDHAQEQVASHRRELNRLMREVETLEHNFVLESMTPQRAAWIEQQIRERLDRIRGLSRLENTPAGKVFGGGSAPAVTPDDVELVRQFLVDLRSRWDDQPNDLKNAFLRLVLDRVLIWPSAETIRARIYWRTGLEQEIMIHVPPFDRKRRWSQKEIETLEQHFAETPQHDLLKMLPQRTWRQILRKGKRLGIERNHLVDPRPSKRSYTPEEDMVVRLFFANEISLPDAMVQLNRSEWSIRKRGQQLGLKKQYKEATWEWIDKEANIPIIGRPSSRR